MAAVAVADTKATKYASLPRISGRDARCEADLSTAYANFCRVTGTPEELVLRSACVPGLPAAQVLEVRPFGAAGNARVRDQQIIMHLAQLLGRKLLLFEAASLRHW